MAQEKMECLVRRYGSPKPVDLTTHTRKNAVGVACPSGFPVANRREIGGNIGPEPRNPSFFYCGFRAREVSQWIPDVSGLVVLDPKSDHPEPSCLIFEQLSSIFFKSSLKPGAKGPGTRDPGPGTRDNMEE